MIRSLGLAALLALMPVSAFGHMCPALMAEVDAALETADLSDEDRARVEELRAEGEEEHAAGNHEASVEALEEAKDILGL